MNHTIASIFPQIQNNILTSMSTSIEDYKNNDLSKGILLSVSKLHRTICLNNIIRLEAASSYTLLYVNGIPKPIIKSKPLKYYSNQLGTNQFIRVHQSHLINKKYIQSYRFKSSPSVTLIDGSTINISRRKLSSIKREFLIL